MSAFRWGYYDLAVNPPAYDFLIFAQMALENGAEGIWFVPGEKLGIRTETDEELKTRLEHVAFPLCDLLGLKREYGPWQGGISVWPDERCLLRERTKRRGHSLFWLKELKKPFPVRPTNRALDKVNDTLKGRRPIVVTLRQAVARPLRNSGPDWRRWAQDHDAVVLDDWCVSRISIDERLAYYDLASLNIGSLSGQMFLCLVSEHRPYLALKALNRHYKHDASIEWWEKHGWKPGDQMPWASHQKIVWGYDDDYGTIEREFQAFR